MSQYDHNEEVSQNASEQAKRTANTAKNGINVATRKIQRATRKRVRKLAKRARNRMIRLGIKAGAKVAAALAKLVMAFLPYILIAAVILFSVYWIYAVVADLEIEDKFQVQNLQHEIAREFNQVTYDANTNKYEIIERSNGNKLAKILYAYMAQKGYWKIVKNEKGKVIQELVRGDQPKAKKYVDKYNREKEFIFNSDLLYLLDRYLNTGNDVEFYFPEQFIQPVYHDEEYNLKDLKDKNGDLVVKSTKFDQKGKPTKEKTVGLWDYGFGSIMEYQEYKEEREKRAEKTGTYQWNFKTHELEKVKIPKGQGEKLTEKVEGYPKKMYLITKVTNAIGTINNNVKVEWVQTGETFTKEVTRKIKAEKEEVYEEWVQEKSVDGKPLYWKYNPEEVSIYAGNEHTTEKTDWKVMRKIKGTRWVPTEMEIKDTYEGYVWEKIPQYEGEPNTDGIVGEQYIFDYLTNYTSYVPKTVMESLNIEERTGRDMKELEEIFKEQNDLENAESEYDRAPEESSESHNIQLTGQITGEKAKYERAAQYMSLYEKYGKMYGVDPYLLLALAAQESGGSDYIDVSRYGKVGVGLMQIIKSTGQSGVTAVNLQTGKKDTLKLYTAQDHNAEKSIQFAAMYLQGLIGGQKGNVIAAIRSYNSGGGAMKKAMMRFAADKGISLDEAYKRPPEEWLGYNTVDDVKFVEHVLQYYASPEGTPWIMDSKGNKYLANGTIQKGAVIVGDGTGDNKGWFQHLIESIKGKWSDLFEDVPEDSFSQREKLEWVRHENPLTEYQYDEFIRVYRTFIEDKRYSELDQEWTLEDWKAKYKALFENPTLGTAAQNNPDIEGHEEFLKYFPDGVETPIEKIKGIVNDSSGGVLLKVAQNTPVKAMISGTVIQVNVKDGVVKLEQNNGVTIQYTGLKEIKVKKGESVSMGDQIALSKGDVGLIINESNGTTIDATPYFAIMSGSSQIYDFATVLSHIERVKGYPYKMVGDANDISAGYFDCSGLMQWAFRQVGVNLPRTAYEQYLHVTKIPASQAQPGDLIFFSGTYNTTKPITHVGLYLGNGKFWNAQGKGVRIASLTNDPLDGNFWSKFPHYFGRITKK